MPNSLAHQLEPYREWLKFLARAGLDKELRKKIDASDIAQETLIRACDKLPDELTDRKGIRAWLKKVLGNVLTDEARKYTAQKRDVKLERAIEVRIDESAFALEVALSADHSHVDEKLIRQEATGQAWAALMNLPELERRAIAMKHCEGRTVQEIAAALGKTNAAVAGLLRRGLKSLRADLPWEL